jgi:hypothetical protein
MRQSLKESCAAAKPDIIEADQYIKSWCKHGIVDGRAAFTNIAVADDEILDTTSY